MPARLRPWLAFVAAVLLVPWLVTLRAELTSADVFLRAGDALTRQWRYRDAFTMYGNAERVAEGPQRALAGVGLVSMAVRLAEFDFAFAKAGQLRRQFPDAPLVDTVFAEAAWASGLFDEAESSFVAALGRSPADGRARLGMARVLIARGHLEEALDNSLAAMAVLPEEADPHYLTGSISARLGQVDRAIQEYTKYLSLLPDRETDKRTWMVGEIRFLRSFGRRVPGQIDPAQLTRRYTMPFRLVKDKVVVKARVNGGEWLDFVVDTGAERTVISDRTARRLGIVPISATLSAGVGDLGLRGLQNAWLDSFELGPLVVKNLPCLIKNPPLSALPAPEAEAFSPLALGLSLIVDYKKKELTIGRDLPAERHDVELPMWFYRLATVRGLVNANRPVSFVVDTGGEVVSIGLDTARSLAPAPDMRRIPLQVFGVSGWDRDAYLQPGVHVAFDALPVRESAIVVLNLRAPSVLLGYRIGGIVGHRFLSRYRVCIDLGRATLGLSAD
jgi:tetratricopeptide (TPR) repeat protein